MRMFFNSKKIIGALLALTVLICRAAEINVQIQPENITLADSGVLVLSLPADAGNPKIDLPVVDGIRWNNQRGSSQRYSNINGRISGSLQLQFGFDPKRTGSVTIPALSVTTSGGKKLESAPFTFTIKKAPDLKTDEARAAETAFITLTPADADRKKYYDGEKVTFHLNVCIRSDYRIAANPGIDFSAEPEQAVLFDRDRQVVREMPVTVKGNRFYCYVISVDATLKGSGKIRMRAGTTLILQDGSTFFGRSFRKKCSAECEIESSALPTPPENAPFAGITGSDFQFEPGTLPGSIRAGEPLTLQFRLSGNTDWEKFRFPTLKEKGFRSYPPEITVQGRNLTFRQTLIPLQPGDLPLRAAFSVFDINTGKYREFSVEKTLAVEKNPNASTAAVPPAIEPVNKNAAGAEDGEQDDIYYLINDTAPLSIPLWRNALMPSLILLVSAILLYSGLYFLLLRKKLLAEDPAYLRKNAVRNLRKELLDRLENGEQPSRMTAGLMEFLTAALDLAPGASLSQCADAVEKRDPAFAVMLRELSSGAWLPEDQRRIMPESDLKKFRSALGKISVFLALFLLPFSAFAASSADGVKAYDEGRFQEALNIYLQRIQPGHAAASDLYNAGNCYCKLGDYARALVMYERALKLAPQNENIRANRDFLRRRFELKEKDLLHSPGDLPVYVMRLLRVDQWIIASVAGAILALGSTGFFFFYRRKILIVLISCGALLLIGASVAALGQYHAEENDRAAIIVTPGTKVYSLPSLNGAVKEELGAGCEVIADEQRQEWVRIRFGGEEGWIHKNDLLPLKME